VAQGHFRADLYYRLSVVSVEVPALRARREDLGIITAELLRRRGFSPGPITGPNFDRLRVHSWPGNVRELRNVLERALALSVGATDFASLRIALMPDGAAGPALSVRSDHPWKEAKDSLLLAFEEKYLRDVHERFDGNLSAGARFAQVDRKHWRELLQKHGLVTKGDPSPE
jgi:DNA-binding NtrC family response regulator